MTAEFDALTAEVARNTTEDQSVIALVNGLADQIAALKDDPAALQALADQLRASNDAVAAAIAANTPSAPPPADQPPADQPPADVPPADGSV